MPPASDPPSKSMDATINALGQLLVQALPTFFIVLVLHFYLKQTFFKPLSRVLAERREATQGRGSRRGSAGACQCEGSGL